jgi:hypothetical protein
MRDSFRVIEAIDADDERAADKALEHVLDERQSLRTVGETGESHGLDADRKDADAHRPLGKGEIKIVAVQAAFAREVAAEIEGVVSGLEADKIVFAERWHEALVVRQCGQHFRRWARDVKEEADTVLVAALAERLAERHQVIIMHPDEILRPEHIVQLAREVIIDTQIAAQIAARELGKVNAVVQDRPQHAIGEAVVVFLVVLLREIERDIGDLVVHNLPRCDLGARGDLPAPAEPDAGRVLEGPVHGDFQSAGVRLYIFRGNGDPIRDYDELRQERSSQLRDSLIAVKPTFPR